MIFSLWTAVVNIKRNRIVYIVGYTRACDNAVTEKFSGDKLPTVT
jgi:hypothetical protein